MTARRSPDGQLYTEVPVVPRHDQLEGRSLENSHPISAIAGLQDALDSKADVTDGMRMVTDEEKAKLGTVEEGAERNAIEAVRVNGLVLDPDAGRVVDITVPSVYGSAIGYASGTRRIQLRGPTGAVISEAAIPDTGIASASFNPSTKVLTFRLQDGTTQTVDLTGAVDAYMAGAGLALTDGVFSLTSAVQDAVGRVPAHVSDQTGHVSAADRAKWDKVAAEAVRTSGAQSIAGAKTFGSPVTVAAPTSDAHAATKAYVDAAVADATDRDWTWVSDYSAGQYFQYFQAPEPAQYGTDCIALKEMIVYAAARIFDDIEGECALAGSLHIPKGMIVPREGLRVRMYGEEETMGDDTVWDAVCTIRPTRLFVPPNFCRIDIMHPVLPMMDNALTPNVSGAPYPQLSAGESVIGLVYR